MEQFETMKKEVSNIVTFKYVIKYTDKDEVEHYITSKETYKKSKKARNVGKNKMFEMRKKMKAEGCKNFSCKLKQAVMPKKELNKILSMNSLKEDEVYEKKWNIIRKGRLYSIEEVLSQYKENDAPVDFDGDLIPMGSHRYANFKFHGVTCTSCGMTGQYFRKERFANNTVYHFNLYAIDNNGKEILMTKDHIIAKANGGKDEIENYQPFCECCNKSKATMSQEEFMRMRESEKKQSDEGNDN